MMPLLPSFVDSLMCSALLHLQLDDTPVYGLGVEGELDFDSAVLFGYPVLAPNVLQLSELRADEKKARRQNRQLRLKLCAYWNAHVETTMAGCKGWLKQDYWMNLIQTSNRVQHQLQPEGLEGGTKEAEDSADEAEDGEGRGEEGEEYRAAEGEEEEGDSEDDDDEAGGRFDEPRDAVDEERLEYVYACLRVKYLAADRAMQRLKLEEEEKATQSATEEKAATS